MLESLDTGFPLTFWVHNLIESKEHYLTHLFICYRYHIPLSWDWVSSLLRIIDVSGWVLSVLNESPTVEGVKTETKVGSCLVFLVYMRCLFSVFCEVEINREEVEEVLLWDVSPVSTSTGEKGDFEKKREQKLNRGNNIVQDLYTGDKQESTTRSK